MASTFLLTQCNESTILGTDLIPGVDNIHTFQTDSFTVYSTTGLVTDSIVANRGNYEKVVGTLTTDPVFGKTHAFLYTQFGLPNSSFSFAGTNQVLDSVVLSFSFDDYYGDSLAPLKINVYPVTQPGFRADTFYYTFQSLAYDPSDLLGSVTVTPRSLRDSVKIRGKTDAPQLRIRLNNAVGQSLLAQKSTGAFLNDSAFHAFFKGVALVPDTLAGGKSLIYLNLNATTTKLSVYYKNSTSDSLVANFPFTGNTCAHSNFILHNYNGSEVANYINKNATTDSLVFLQNAPGYSPGVFANLKFPYLQNFPNALINKAELILTEVSTPGGSDNIYQEPDRLFLQEYDNNGSLKNLPDIILNSSGQISNLDYFGGKRNFIANFAGVQVAEYRFNIANYVQRVLKNQETSNRLKLTIFPFRRAYGRVKLGGGNHTMYKIKLRVIYTKL